MGKIIMILAILASTLSAKECVAISEHELVSADGNVWRVLDELEPKREYTVVFDTLDDDVLKNDEIVRVWG